LSSTGNYTTAENLSKAVKFFWNKAKFRQKATETVTVLRCPLYGENVFARLRIFLVGGDNLQIGGTENQYAVSYVLMPEIQALELINSMKMIKTGSPTEYWILLTGFTP